MPHLSVLLFSIEVTLEVIALFHSSSTEPFSCTFLLGIDLVSLPMAGRYDEHPSAVVSEVR